MVICPRLSYNKSVTGKRIQGEKNMEKIKATELLKEVRGRELTEEELNKVTGGVYDNYLACMDEKMAEGLSAHYAVNACKEFLEF